MAAISKELREMSQQPWFPIMMRELGYEPIKHGRWKEDEYGFLVCSECGNTAEYLPILGQIETPYCSECGARMDEQQEAEE